MGSNQVSTCSIILSCTYSRWEVSTCSEEAEGVGECECTDEKNHGQEEDIGNGSSDLELETSFSNQLPALFHTRRFRYTASFDNDAVHVGDAVLIECVRPVETAVAETDTQEYFISSVNHLYSVFSSYYCYCYYYFFFKFALKTAFPRALEIIIMIIITPYEPQSIYAMCYYY